MFQKWRELLFLHWEYDPQAIQRTLPPGLHVDTYQGKAYLGLVPFFMGDIRPRFCPTVPGLSNFLEVNLRTYVYDEQGVAGVWFYSLDANQWLAVQVARTFFKLPYFYAKMSAVKNQRGEITYRSWRRGSDPALTSHFRYRASGPVRQAEPGSLEFFLIERYILFANPTGRGQLSTGQVYHTPYPICQAEAPQWDTQLLTLGGFEPPDRPPDHVLMSPGVAVDIFALQPSKI
jgi:uncharacterized protein YqjF (DUF2071 family)